MMTTADPTTHPTPTLTQSETLGELADALSKAQGALERVTKTHTANTERYSYTYADLASVIAAIREPFSANGLAYHQAPEIHGDAVNGATVTVVTRLLHSSGEWIRSACTVPAADWNAQKVGSAITYARRYGLMAAVGLAPEDDDAQAAMPVHRPALTKTKAAAKGKTEDDLSDVFGLPSAGPAKAPTDSPNTGDERPISEKQAKRLFAIAKAHERDLEDVRTYLRTTYGVEHSTELLRRDYDQACAWLEEA